ncbi:MAG TPA: DNRLRE domain-containing protein [Myxococcaceae bacterium]|nr:DNRLRE domain-containing protein [Myxococcaceae bacterium]
MRLSSGWRCGVASIVIVAGSVSGAGEGVQLNPIKDNTLYEDDTGGTTSNGQGQNFFVGPVGSLGNGLVRRGVIAFDIAGNIPAGAMIESVTLTLHASSTRQTPDIQVDLYAALSDWGEGASNADEEAGGGRGAPAQPGDATWVNTFYPDQLWGAEGGDFATSPTSSIVVSADGFFSFDSTVDAGLVSDVQQWLDQPETNFGWLLKAADEAFIGSAKRFATRENLEPTFQPLLTVTYSSCGATVQLNPSKDNTLYEDDTGGTTSNGQGQNFFVGPVGAIGNGLIRRGLIAFDIAGNVPAGATIESVTLTLHASSTRQTPDIQVDLYAALSDWGEGASNADGDAGGGRGAPAQPGDATWVNTFYPDQLWGSEGGDFAASPSSSIVVSAVGFFSFDSTVDAGLTTDVQQWLDQPDTNFGWLLKASDEAFSGSAKRFDTRENTEPTFQPLLTVTYSSCGAPGEAGAVRAPPAVSP